MIDQAKSKNNIAENSVALGHETHNRSVGQCYTVTVKLEVQWCGGISMCIWSMFMFVAV